MSNTPTITDDDRQRMGDCGEAGLRALEEILDTVVEAHGFVGVAAAQMRFVIAIHLLGTVAQRSRLTKEYALAQVAEKLPRAMDAAEGDEHLDIHRGGVPS